MNRKAFSGIVLAQLLMSMFTLAFGIGPAASEADPLRWTYAADGRIYATVISAAGEYVLAGSDDSNVYALDLTTGQRIWNYTTGDWSDVQHVSVFSVFASPDSQYAIAGTASNVYCFNLTSGARRWNYTTGEARSVFVAPDSTWVVAGSADGNVRSLHTDNGTLKWQYPTQGKVLSVAISPDGKYVLAGSEDGVLALNATGNFLWNYSTNGGVPQKALFISPDSRCVIAGDTGAGADGGRGHIYALNITTGGQMWNFTATGTPLGDYTNIPLTSVCVSSDSQYVAAGTGNGRSYYLDSSDGRLIWEHTAGGYMREVAISPDGRFAVAATGGAFSPWPYVPPNVFLLRTADGSEIWNYTTRVQSIAVCPDSETIIVGTGDCNVHAIGATRAYTFLGEGWPTFQHDLTRLGTTISSAPDRNFTLWTFDTGGPVSSSPVVVQGKIYFGSEDNRVYCLNASTGVRIWNYTTGSTANSPTVVGDRVYVGANGDKLYCLDACTGTLVWNYTNYGVNASPAVADGRVYVGAWDNWFYCLKAATGELVWKFDPWAPFEMSSAAVAEGRVYVGSKNRKLYCLNASTGTLIWNYTTGDFVQSSPAVADGQVYVGSADHNVYCLNAATGTLIWNYTTGSGIVSSPAVVDNRVYIGSADWRANVYCLNTTTGAQIWNYTTAQAVHSSPAVAGNRVYVGSYDNSVYCLDALTGALVWKYETGGAVLSSPAIADGRTYVGSFDGTVYAFGSYTYSFPVEVSGTLHPVAVVSNSFISDFSFNQSSKTISFTATGTPGTSAFANLTVPTALLGGPYTVLEDGSPKTQIEAYNATHASLYIEYVNDVHAINVIGTTIIPDYPIVSVNPATLDFGGKPVDYPPILNGTTIRNVGGEPLTVESIAITIGGDAFTIKGIYREGPLGALFATAPPFTLNPGRSGHVRVEFDDVDELAEPFAGTLEIVSNDPNNTKVQVSLLGAGQTASGAGTWIAEEAIPSVAPGEKGRWELQVDVGGNITQATVFSALNVLQYTANLTEDNKGVVIEGILENPDLPGQMSLEIKSANSTEKLNVYNIIIGSYLPGRSTYTVNWDGTSFQVMMQSNSTISNFNFSQPAKRVNLNVKVPLNMAGYCNVTIPRELLGGPYSCLFDGAPATPIETHNSTHASIYVTYTEDGALEITGTTVIPEFPATTGPLLLLALLSLALLYVRMGKENKRAARRFHVLFCAALGNSVRAHYTM